MFRRFLILGVLLLLVPLNAQALEIGARGIYWFAGLDADIRLEPGDTIDVDEVLGLDDEDIPMVEGFFGIGGHHFLVGWSNPVYEADTITTDDFDFGGITFPAGTVLDSDIDYTMIDFVYQWDFIDLENILAGFSAGLVVQAKLLDGNVTLDGDYLGTPVKVSEDFTLVVPGVGLGAHAGILIDLVEARGRIAGTIIHDNVFYDGFLELNITPFPFMDIGAGYRVIKLDLEEVDDLTIDLTQDGWYASLALKW